MMTTNIHLNIADPRWTQIDLTTHFERLLAELSKTLPIDARYEISVLATNDPHIAELNDTFREKPSATNVLSWPSFELEADNSGDMPHPLPPFDPMNESLGDIAISFDTCEREALAQGKDMTDHLHHLLLHSVLHLLGFDHIRDKDAELMENLEREMLANMGIDDPYKESA